MQIFRKSSQRSQDPRSCCWIWRPSSLQVSFFNARDIVIAVMFCREFAHWTAATFLSRGVAVHLFSRVVPTPFVVFASFINTGAFIYLYVSRILPLFWAVLQEWWWLLRIIPRTTTDIKFIGITDARFVIQCSHECELIQSRSMFRMIKAFLIALNKTWRLGVLTRKSYWSPHWSVILPIKSPSLTSATLPRSAATITYRYYRIYSWSD